MRVCFYGLGSIGCRHLKNLYNICHTKCLPLEVHAVRSTSRCLPGDIERLVNKQFSNIPKGINYDAIFITNPTALHYQTILETKHHSRCFFIEKPIFADAVISIEELQLPKENCYYIAAPLRYTGVIQYISEFVQKNRIYCARAISSSYLPDWRPGIDYRKVYSAHKDLGGGVAIDLIHEWDYLISLFGFPKRVVALKGRVSDLEIDSEDIAVYLGDYGNRIVEVHLDYFGRESKRQVELFTKDITLTGDILNGQILFSDGRSPYSIKENINDRYMREMEYFLSLVQNPLQDSSNSLEQALKTLQVAIQANAIS